MAAAAAAAPSRYESQKRRDWKTFLQFLKNHKPPLTQARCSGAHVIEFLKYLDQFGKTKVHVTGCPCFGQPNPPAPCACPLKQAWGSHDALIGRLRAAYEENGGRAESNPFGARAVTIYLREVREGQAKARGIPYEKKKRKRATEELSVGGGGGSSSGGGGDVVASVAPPSSITNERAMLEKENMLKLEEDAKMENEKLHGRIFDLGKKLDVSQSMELEIAGTMVSIQMAKPMGVEHNMEIDRKMESLEKDLKDKEEEIEGLETLNETLVVKEHSCNGELLEARKELIDGLMQSDGNIGVKKMGDLDTKPFQAAAEKKFRGREIERKAAEWCSLWEKYLRDPRWHPFKVVQLGEIDKEILDMEDDRLKALKEELGDEVVKAVTTALTEMNDYNASGRYPVDELWNFQEGRKATLKEGISHLLIQLKLEKQNRNAHS